MKSNVLSIIIGRDRYKIIDIGRDNGIDRLKRFFFNFLHKNYRSNYLLLKNTDYFFLTCQQDWRWQCKIIKILMVS